MVVLPSTVSAESASLKNLLHLLVRESNGNVKRAILRKIDNVSSVEHLDVENLSPLIGTIKENDDASTQICALTTLGSLVANNSDELSNTVVDYQLFECVEKILNKVEALDSLAAVLYFITATCRRSKDCQNLVRETKCLRVLKLLVQYTIKFEHKFAMSASICLTSCLTNPTNAENQVYCRKLLPLVVDCLFNERNPIVVDRVCLIGTALLKGNEELFSEFEKLNGTKSLYRCVNSMVNKFSNIDLISKDIISVFEKIFTFLDLTLNHRSININENFSLLVLKLFQIHWISKCDSLFTYLLQFCLAIKEKNSGFFAVHSLDRRLQSILDSSLDKTTDDSIRFLTSKLLNLFGNDRTSPSSDVSSRFQKTTAREILHELDKKKFSTDRRVAEWLIAIDEEQTDNDDDDVFSTNENFIDEQNCHDKSSLGSKIERGSKAKRFTSSEILSKFNRNQNSFVQSPTYTNFYSCGSINEPNPTTTKRKHDSIGVDEDSSSCTICRKCCCCRATEAAEMIS